MKTTRLLRGGAQREEKRIRYDEYGAVSAGATDKTSDSFRQRLEADALSTLQHGGKPLYKAGAGDLVQGVRGVDFTLEYARRHGLSRPIRFAASERDALGIQVPLKESEQATLSAGEPKKHHARRSSSSTAYPPAEKQFTPRDVATLLGKRKVIAVSVKSQQSNAAMSLEEWADYWEGKPKGVRAKKGVLNLISLEFSSTPLLEPSRMTRPIPTNEGRLR